MSTQYPKLSSLLSLEGYREQREHIFPSPGSLQWFIREHREELVRAGALLMIARRRQIMPEPFDIYVIENGIREASRESTPA